MNEIKIFRNNQFGEIRTLDIDGEPWFVGKDVAQVLGYTDTFGALKKHVDEEDKQNCQNDSFETPRGMTIINESGLYSLILSSKMESAKAFKRWITSEVIPSIRKHGGYLAGQETMSDEELMAKALLVAQNKLAEREKKLKFLETTVAIQNQQIAELQPKATYYDIVLQCEDAIPLTIIAKDYGWSANAMNRFLQENNVQYKVNGTWVLKNPHARKGFTTTKTHVHRDRYQKVHTTVHTYWTQKGRLFIYELMKGAGNLPLIEIDG